MQDKPPLSPIKNTVDAMAPLWQAYTEELLAWDGMGSSASAQPYAKEEFARLVERGLKHAQRGEHKLNILLGCHPHALDVFSPATPLLIIESQPEQAKTFLRAVGPLPAHVHILVDSSPWALFMLTGVLGLSPEKCALFFSHAPKQRSPILEQWRKLFLGSMAKTLAQNTASTPATRPTLSLAAIMHPQEKHVEEFFAHIPSYVQEVVIIWDADDSQAQPLYPCAAPVKYHYRPLQGHFGEQRNAMLKACTGDWVLYLDADERLSPSTWQALPQFMQEEHAGGVLFPRHTYEPAQKIPAQKHTSRQEHSPKQGHPIRMAFGLWPDVQLRLFPRRTGVHFEGSIHEKVLGLQGNTVLAAAHPILHYSHVHKNEAELRQRLAVFNAAGPVQHTLSAAYPHLSQAFFQRMQTLMEQNGARGLWHLPV